MPLRTYLNLLLGLVIMVVLLGGWTRIMDAGLGCPDWPGCYGHIVLPLGEEQLQQAQLRYPDTPLETAKGWLEMVHRYAASTLGLMMIGLVVLTYPQRSQRPDLFRFSLVLLGLVCVQGLFGMWTVTWKLLPQVVTVHLLGGVIILSALVLFRQRLSARQRFSSGLAFWALGAATLLQVSTGGWTSANYAGWACEGILICSSGYDFAAGFDLQTVGPNYQGGILTAPARAAIVLAHKLGALLLAALIVSYLIYIWRRRRFSKTAWCVLVALGGQIGLGIMNLVWSVPTALAMAHHAGAIVLVVSLICLLSEQTRRRMYEHT